MKKNNTLFILIPFFIFVLTGCSFSFAKKPNPTNNQDGNNKQELVEKANLATSSKSIENILSEQSNIKKFETPEELKDFLENQVEDDSFNYRGRMLSEGSSVTKEVFNEISFSRDESASQKLSDSTKDFSETNVQVEGVDESDIVKTDGEYIYSLSNNELFIIKANPAEDSKIMSKIKFESNPSDLYIKENKLVVFGANTQIYKEGFTENFKRRAAYTYFKIFDISDKSNPKQIKSLDFEGSYSNSRMIGDYVYFITNNYNYFIDNEPMLPRIISDGVDIACTLEKCIMPDVYYFSIPYNNYNFTSVNVLDLKNLETDIEREVYILSDSQNIYVSQDNIYITYTKYISEEQLVMELTKEVLLPMLSKQDAEKINNINSAEKYILSDSEKIYKINLIIERHISSLSADKQGELEKEIEEKIKIKYKDISKELEKTVIHKIGISGSEIEYKSSGEVVGYVLNQFSMDENNGYFRIATTKSNTWSRFEDNNQKSYSNLYVLDEDLKQIGAIENLAPDERIYSARFMQDRAYLVTFKQTDPLFVIDLSSPTEPRVLGELKIPGFSNYLHPYDNTTLIGLGKDAKLNENGGVVTGGLKLSLFDVSDVLNPKEVDNVIVGGLGSDSIALNDHKAFLFSAEKNLLVIPATIRESADPSTYGEITLRGALWFDIKKDSIVLKEKISHYKEGQLADIGYYWNGYNYFSSSVKRSLYINDILYTISDEYIKMNSLQTANEVNKLELKLDKKEDFEIINNN